MQFLDDSVYIENVMNGDTASFAGLVDKHRDMVYTIALRIARNHHDAEEIAQDAFLKVYRSLDSFRQQSKFTTWLYRIVYNTAISRVRKKRHETTAIDEALIENYSVDEVHSQVQGLDEEEQKMLIDATLDKLPEEESTLISLYYLSECSVDEISQITGLTLSNVKVRLHRTRKKMYTLMQQMLTYNMDIPPQAAG